MGVLGSQDSIKWEGNIQHIQLYKFQRLQIGGIDCGPTNLLKATGIWMYLDGHKYHRLPQSLSSFPIVLHLLAGFRD